MSDEEMQQLLDRVHQGITTFDYNQIVVPCIVLEEARFDRLIGKIAGRPISVDANLNILQDGKGHVFVEVILEVPDEDIVETVLVNANKSTEFFKLLADTSMLALSSPHSAAGRENIFMIQLPKPEKAADALDIIQRGLKQNTYNLQDEY